MTKAKAICFFMILAVLIAGAFFQRIYLTKLMDELLSLSEEVNACVSRRDMVSAKDAADRLASRFEEESPILSALLDHNYVCAVYEQLRLLEAELYLDNFQEIPACCAALMHELECINHLETVNLENIF